MIVLLSPERLEEFERLCHTTFDFGARIYTGFAVYGYDSDVARHWLALNEQGDVVAAIQLFDGRFTIAQSGLSDMEELALFIDSFGGMETVEASLALCEALRNEMGGNLCSGTTMQHAALPIYYDFPEVHREFPLKDLYRLICCASGASQPDWSAWYPHTSHLLRHELGYGAIIYDGYLPVATGGVWAMSRSYGVIGSLFTLPECRGKGYGAQLVGYLCRCCADTGRIPLVLCANSDLEGYYGTLGFVAVSQWAQLDRNNTQYGGTYGTALF